MRAAVYLGPGQVELRQAPVPELQPGEILVRVRAALTCGTDIKTYRRGHPKFPPPFIFGHEFGGDIAAVGTQVAGFQVGMRVTAGIFAECGQCFFCRHGQGNLCENLVYNFGAFAEYHRIPAPIVQDNTFEIPDHISYAEAAVLEPLVTVVHGQRLAAIQPGETVAIWGAGGPVSILHAQLALRAGAARVIGIGHSDFRMAVLRSLGVSELINAHTADPLAAVRRLTGGYGADVVIECAGAKDAWEASTQAVRRGGRVLWFGGLPGQTRVELDATRLHYGEINLINSHGGDQSDARQAYALIASNQIDTACLLSGELPLERIEEAFQRVISGDAIKMVINPLL